MQVGPPPANGFGVDWRGAAYVQDNKSPVVAPLSAELGTAHDSSGGWMVKGPGGNIKMTQPTAFTTTMLAWGVLSFPAGYGASKQKALTQIQVRSACVRYVSSLCTCASISLLSQRSFTGILHVCRGAALPACYLTSMWR